ncbi:MAG: right-handed parallel beta-helix repeat-containing protein [Firmicutes bacterium]|nr:right-handed parallel beta-helix repeat-containing protein [Bacillota bacterium]
MIINIKDFTKPGDSDSAEGIRKALEYAKTAKASKVVFEAGVYDLLTDKTVETDAMIHDAGSKAEHSTKKAHIVIDSMRGLILEGAVNEDGSPATVLSGHNDGVVHSYLPSILWCQKCSELTIRNIKLKRNPEYGSAGRVVKKTDEFIEVEVFENNPCENNMGAYCMNRFSQDGQTLIGESVTYGDGADGNWAMTGDRQLRLYDDKVALKVNEGEILSWHQGAQTDFQTYFGFCDSLILENIHTSNANGFSMLATYCKDIKARDIKFQPEGNQYFTCPRDAWKLFKCTGNVEIDRMYIEGVRMDGQNVHNNFILMKQRIANNQATFYSRYSYFPLVNGAKVAFYNGMDIETQRIVGWKLEGPAEKGYIYSIEFDGNIPDFVNNETLCLAHCWEPDSYRCSDSTFLNIAGAGHLLRNHDITINGCTYKNTMNPAILLGAQLLTHFEGGHAHNVTISDCKFDNCGFHPRYETSGGIGINSNGMSEPYNHNIAIKDCEFKNMNIGVEVICARDVTIDGCSFENVGQKLKIDEKTCDVGSIQIK